MAKKKRLTTKEKKAKFRKELRKQGLLAKKAKNTPICPVCQKPCAPPLGMHSECTYKAFFDDMLKVFLKYFPAYFLAAAMPIGAGLIAKMFSEKKKPKKQKK